MSFEAVSRFESLSFTLFQCHQLVVQITNHCYEAVDLDDIVRVSVT